MDTTNSVSTSLKNLKFPEKWAFWLGAILGILFIVKYHIAILGFVTNVFVIAAYIVALVAGYLIISSKLFQNVVAGIFNMTLWALFSWFVQNNPIAYIRGYVQRYIDNNNQLRDIADSVEGNVEQQKRSIKRSIQERDELIAETEQAMNHLEAEQKKSKPNQSRVVELNRVIDLNTQQINYRNTEIETWNPQLAALEEQLEMIKEGIEVGESKIRELEALQDHLTRMDAQATLLGRAVRKLKKIWRSDPIDEEGFKLARRTVELNHDTTLAALKNLASDFRPEIVKIQLKNAATREEVLGKIKQRREMLIKIKQQPPIEPTPESLALPRNLDDDINNLIGRKEQK